MVHVRPIVAGTVKPGAASIVVRPDDDAWEKYGRPHFLTRAAFAAWRDRHRAPAGQFWRWLQRLVARWIQR